MIIKDMIKDWAISEKEIAEAIRNLSGDDILLQSDQKRFRAVIRIANERISTEIEKIKRREKKVINRLVLSFVILFIVLSFFFQPYIVAIFFILLLLLVIAMSMAYSAVRPKWYKQKYCLFLFGKKENRAYDYYGW